MYQWLYKEDIESGVKVRLDEVDEYLRDGWVDTPDKYGKKGVQPLDGWDMEKPVVVVEKVAVSEDESELKDMTKEELKLYAKAQFNVVLNKQKSHTNLVNQVEALENGNCI